jgi:lipooligosaccharide transport system ATP-binding protein
LDAPRLLDAQGLVKHFGSRRVVDDVSLRCGPGEVLGLLGANGAGKTTCLRMCYGFLRPDDGAIRILTQDLMRCPDAAKRHLGVCTQDDTFDTDFSVRDNLLQAARYFRPRPENLKAHVESLLPRFGLQQYADTRPEALSGGYKRRLMLARSLVHRPKLLFLDEPTTGLDPSARVGVWDLVDALRNEGLGIVLTTHYMDEAERLSDRLLVLDEGKVVAEGTPKSVLGDLVGEHVVVLDQNNPAADDVRRWLTEQQLPPPARVLHTWHIPVDGTRLAAFSAAFGHARFEVRAPTLDDLFLQLAGKRDL